MANKKYLVSNENQVHEGGIFNQILMSLVVCMPILAYGTAIGWISPHKALLMSDESPAGAPLTEEQVSWAACVMFLFAPPAVFLYGASADRYGRKKALLCSSLPIAMGWGLQLLCIQPWALIVGRALVGFGSGGGFVVCPLYVKEISQDSIRGMTGTFVIFSQTAGNLFVFIIGDLLQFSVVLWICLAIPLLHVMIVLTLPDTPSYLIKCGEKEAASKVLSWLRSIPQDDKTIIEEVDKLVLEQTNAPPKFSPKLLFSDKITVKAFWVALIVNLTREFCGCIAVLVYASHIFDAAERDGNSSIALSSNKQSIMLAVVQIIGSFLALNLVDRLGRKPLLCITSVVAGVAMAVLGAWFYLTSVWSWSISGWVPVAALCVCIFADAAGLQPLPFVIMTEMFSFQLRGTVATLVMAISLATDFPLIKIFSPLISWIGFHWTFWIFSVICLSNVLYLVMFVPETKMKSLDEIYAHLRGNHKEDTKTAVNTKNVVETNHI